MDGPFPCPNTPSQCDTNPNPLTPFSSEAVDSTTFIGLAWQNQLPALNKPFNVFPCEAITESQVSQSDADIQAANQVVICANPCAPTFSNTAQTATGVCPNGSAYSLTIPAGIFTADNQVLADRKAFTAAAAALRGHSICLGSLAPSSVCRGEFYFGTISLITTDSPSSIVLLSGEMAEGLTISLESDRAVVQGIPTSFGTSRFILQATSAAGVVTQQMYEVSVTGIVTDSDLPDGTEGTDYSAQLTAIIPDGSTPSWSVSEGTLPDGLELDANTGEITGTPDAGGDASFTVGVTAAGATCTKEFSMHVASSGPVCITQYATLDIPGNIDGEASGTRDASTRRLAVSVQTDNQIVFVNTATNAIIATTSVPTLNELGNISKGDFAAFATSSKQFYVTLETGVAVFDADGNTITTIAFPSGNTGESACIYSSGQDRIYCLTPNTDTFSRHIIVINPNTNTVVNDVDTLADAPAFLYYASGLDQMLLEFESSHLEAWELAGVTMVNTLSFQSDSGLDYAADIHKWFVPTAEFFAPFHIGVIDGATLTLDTLIAIPSFTGQATDLKYNPVKHTIIVFSVNGEIAVINTSDLSIVCELADADTFSGAVNIDYFSGDDYLLDWNGVDDPLLIYH